jgi:hypothetical protein
MDQIRPRPADLTELPLSTQQRRWWSLVAANPGTMTPLVYLVYRIRGSLDVDAWTRAVGAVVDRHEILRSRFVRRPEGPVQVVDPPKGLDVERIDLGDLPEAAREERARELLNERRKEPFDLVDGPLVTSCLLRLADDDHVWTMTVHHILADGAALGIVDREIGLLYRAFVDGTDPALPDLPIQYGDYAVWCESVPESYYDEERWYWLDRLAGAPALVLPTDFPRPGEKGAPAVDARHEIDRDRLDRLDQLAAATGVTRFMVLLAATTAVLSRHSGQPDFCVGMPVAGVRSRFAELTGVVGVFNNTLAVRADLSGDPTFRELLARTRDGVLDALDYQAIPFSKVLAELKQRHGLDRDQLYQVMFVYEHVAELGEKLPGLRFNDFGLDIPRIPHDLMVYAWTTRAGLTAQFVYNGGLFTDATAAGWTRAFARVLDAAVDDPEARLSRLPVA